MIFINIILNLILFKIKLIIKKSEHFVYKLIILKSKFYKKISKNTDIYSNY